MNRSDSDFAMRGLMSARVSLCVGSHKILVMCETFRPNYFSRLLLSLSLFLSLVLCLHFSYEFYFSALPRARSGTTCLAADQDVAAALFSEGSKGKKNRQGTLTHDVIVHSRFYSPCRITGNLILFPKQGLRANKDDLFRHARYIK